MPESHEEAGFRALTERDWDSARVAFEAALARGSSPDALDGLGRALWWLGDAKEAMKLRTEAYASFRRAGRSREAGQIALWLTREHRTLYRNDPVADGWMARAKRIAAETSDDRLTGWIDLVMAEATTQAAAAVELAGSAVDVGVKSSDRDLEVTALARLGVLEIAVGSVEAGITHLDEAMAAATAGEPRDPQVLADACCALLEAADLLGDMERFAKWAPAIEDYRRSYAYGSGPVSAHATLSAFCGACCGGIYLVSGRLDEAEDELLTSISALESSGMHSRCVHPVTQLAELRVAQGRLEEARALLTPYEDLPEATRPLAALELALGEPEAAIIRLHHRIASLTELPVVAMPLWILLVDASLARGDTSGAQEATVEIERIARLTNSRRHSGEVLFAKGKNAAARDESEAQTLLRAAARTFSEGALPYLACRARLALARAAAAAGNPGVAISEGRAALSALERLGATSEADAAAAFLRELGVKGRTGPRDLGALSKRELEVLRLLAQGLSNAEISQRLFISVKTTGHHVSNVLAKLNVKSRTEAAAFAALNLPPDGPRNRESSRSSPDATART